MAGVLNCGFWRQHHLKVCTTFSSFQISFDFFFSNFLLFMAMSLCMSVCVYGFMPHTCWCLWRLDAGSRGVSYRWLWAPWLWYWELNVDPMLQVQVLRHLPNSQYFFPQVKYKDTFARSLHPYPRMQPSDWHLWKYCLYRKHSSRFCVHPLQEAWITAYWLSSVSLKWRSSHARILTSQ